MKHLRPWLFTGPSLLVIAALVVFPILFTVWLSFTNLGIFTWQNPAFAGLKNYERILGNLDSGFFGALGFTLAWTALNLAIQFVLALAVALLLNVPGLRGAGIYKTIIILPWAVPSYISALVWRNGMFNEDYGLLNRVLASLGAGPVPWLSTDGWAFLSLLAVNLWLALPFLILVILGGLQSIDKDYYDSAKIDGAGWWAQIRTITIPLLGPVLAPAMLMTAFVTFKQFDLVYLMLQQTGSRTGASIHTVITYAYEKAFVTNNYGLSAALSVVIFAIMVVLTLVTWKRPGKELR